MNPEENNEIRNVANGLRDLPPDSRDFKLGSIVDLPALSELPEVFEIGLPKVKDQKDSDFCAAFSSCAVSELQEGVELCPEWVFAVAKMIDGDVNGFGADLRTICQVHQKYGAIEMVDAPYSLEKGSGVDFLRRIENWPKDLFTKALAHQKGSYFSVETTDTDRFDSIRRTMWNFRNEKCGVVFGVLWGWSLGQIIMATVPAQGSGHALAQIGWTKDPEGSPAMFIQNSYGPNAGYQGRHYFSREVINAFADRFGCFMFHDMPAAKAKTMLENGTKIGDNLVTRLWKTLMTILKNFGRKNAGSVRLENI